MADKPLRRALFTLLAPLPRQVRLKLDRRLRGFGEARKLRRAEAVVVSFPKSGRTWMRALLSYYYTAARNLETGELLGFDNYHALDASVPRILFTHDNHLVDWLGQEKLEQLYAERPVVLLTRDPRDVVVSAFHQTRHRTDPLKKALRGKDDPRLADLSTFLRDPEWGLARHLAFLERWRSRLDRLPRVLLVRYEDLKRDTAGEFERVLHFLGERPNAEAIGRAVEESSFERMRAKERSGTFASSSRRFGGRVDDPNAFKVREAKIGGWQRHFHQADVAWMEATIAARLDPVFGYSADERSAPAPTATAGPEGSAA